VRIDLEVEAVEKPVHHRREQNADHRDERDSTEERVESGKEVEMG
jgi:hypothetical protein